jgi:hypothetical protein
MGYIKRCLVGFDQFANVVIGGTNDETISARAGRLRFLHPYTWGFLAKALDIIQYQHVEGAITHDEQRAEEVVKEEKRAETEGL